MSMENGKFETLMPSADPSLFPPRPRSHLKSRTYSTLIRILSVCSHESPRPHAAGTAQDRPKQDDGSKEPVEETEVKIHEEAVTIDSTEPQNSLLHKGLAIDENFEAICLQDTGFKEALSALETELEDTIGIKGNGELIQGDNSIPSTSLPNTWEDGSGSLLENNQEIRLDCKQDLMMEGVNAGQLQLEIEDKNGKVSRDLDSSLDEEMMSEVSKQAGDGEGKGSSLEKIMEEAQHIVQQKGMEIEKSVCTAVAMDSSHCVTAEGDTEEGEISGDDVYIEFSMEDNTALEEMVVEEQSSKGKGLMNEEKFTGNESRANEEDSEHTSSFNTVGIQDHVNKEYLKESCTRKMIKYDYDAVFHKEPDIQGIKCSKKDVDACNKKRGGLSDERKEKRKRQKKVKRAEKNRKLGIRRLKLQPVSKPKTVTFCRHFLHGRCQQGADCKFSHDTVPLTKSKPCCHFAKQACMKGEDCPFDHQLSNYPCSNYVSKGFCSRGDNCMFSHKVPPREGSTTVSIPSKPDEKPSSSPSTSNPNTNALSVSWKNAQRSLAASLLKMPAQAPKGITFLSRGKSPLGSSGSQDDLSSNKDDNTRIGNPTIQTTAGMSQNTKEIPVTTSVAGAPKGINSLIFGKDPSATIPSNKGNIIGKKPTNDSDKCEPACSAPRREDPSSAIPSPKGNITGKMPTDDSEMCKPACLSPRRDHCAEAGDPAKGLAPSLVPNMYESPKITPTSVGKAQVSESSYKTQASFPLGMKNNSGICIREREDAPIAMPGRVAASPLVPDRSADELNKYKSSSSSSSAPKALLSTLAVATKFKPQIRVDRTAAPAAATAEANKDPKDSSSSSGAQTGSTMASTILDFLFGDGK